jgi:hypothetical protein
MGVSKISFNEINKTSENLNTKRESDAFYGLKPSIARAIKSTTGDGKTDAKNDSMQNLMQQ